MLQNGQGGNSAETAKAENPADTEMKDVAEASASGSDSLIGPHIGKPTGITSHLYTHAALQALTNAVHFRSSKETVLISVALGTDTRLKKFENLETWDLKERPYQGYLGL